MNSESNRFCEKKFIVPFHDLDPMQIMWHGNYLKYFDMTRSALFDKAGVDLFGYFKNTRYLFPITKTQTKYIASLGYLDEFKCAATILEAEYKIVMDFQIRLVEGNQICARGRSEQVAVKYPEKELMFEIPEEIRKAFGF